MMRSRHQLVFLLVFTILIGGIVPIANATDPNEEKQTASDTATEAETKRLDAQIAMLEKKTALIKAKAALVTAEAAAFKASFGDIPKADTSGWGGVTLKEDKMGQTEAALLVGRALTEAAATLGDRIKNANPGEDNRTVLLFPSKDLPTFNNLISFNAQATIVETAFKEAIAASANLLFAEIDKALAPVTVIGTVLDSVNKLLGYFKTDYETGGVAVSPDNLSLAYETANALRTRMPAWKIELPSVYNPAALMDSGSMVIEKLTALSKLKETALLKVKQHEQARKGLKEQAAAEKGEKHKKESEETLQKHTQAEKDLTLSITLFDKLFGKLITFDDKSTVPPIAPLVKEAIIQKALQEDGSLLLVVNILHAGGSYYTKKNLWTTFGSMPLYFMGGATVSFAMLDGKTGQVLASGIIPIHGGFVKAGKMRSTLEGK